MEKRYGAPIAGGEKEVLAGFLDHYRHALLSLCEGLSQADLRRPVVPSGTSLLGLVKHLSRVERSWFQENVGLESSPFPFDENDPDADFRIEEGESPEEIFEMYREACAKSRDVLAAASMDDPIRGPNRSRDYNVRWVVVHMLEETARHVGHADILREQIDGRTEVGYAF